ncbi:uncharacterized protein YutE (UPF0331/DUF86 family) [Hydrogenivirga caldilitoris]|uniref:Uncharacterized protein YutE (UPF0331/DUF86 family) n=1 Tax=Hydrogenivirga caldilitoris TaxID=246264 RepID=A0A497XQ78_9AQUI|nr:HepT-like ribonuclease domain-containing protein [Hydrogenivirga caldilitoris]RLJ71058.1 uncharacterized protein YutE (UPF0331/DUF86 family) [Hydrogenivirga caldilitoris]
MSGVKKKGFKISLIVEAFQNLEKSYVDLKKHIALPEDEFVSNKLVLDRVRIDFNLAFESSMRVCRHMSSVLGLKTSSKDCLVKLAQHIGMEEVDKLQDFTEFYFKYRDLKEAVSPEELYRFLKENLSMFKEYARAVINYIKETTGNYLLIDFDLLNEKSKFIKESVKKIDFVLQQGYAEFKSKPMYYDRVKYFYQVAYDSLFDICKHLAPKFGVKRFGDDCLSKLVEAGVIPQEYYMDVFKLTNLKNKLISTWEVPPEELYSTLKELNPKFDAIVKEISKSLKDLLSKGGVRG